jgi:histone H3/H4
VSPWSVILQLSMMSAQEDDFDNPKNDILMEMDGSNPSAPTGSGAIFPLARIKKIMKADKDVNLVSADAVTLVSLATEMFLDAFVKKASDISQNEKRRTILYKDFGNQNFKGSK